MDHVKDKFTYKHVHRSQESHENQFHFTKRTNDMPAIHQNRTTITCKPRKTIKQQSHPGPSTPNNPNAQNNTQAP